MPHKKGQFSLVYNLGEGEDLCQALQIIKYPFSTGILWSANAECR